eukprot:2993704-Rhodomonas_salina.1
MICPSLANWLPPCSHADPPTLSRFLFASSPFPTAVALVPFLASVPRRSTHPLASCSGAGRGWDEGSAGGGGGGGGCRGPPPGMSSAKPTLRIQLQATARSIQVVPRMRVLPAVRGTEAAYGGQERVWISDCGELSEAEVAAAREEERAGGKGG